MSWRRAHRVQHGRIDKEHPYSVHSRMTIWIFTMNMHFTPLFAQPPFILSYKISWKMRVDAYPSRFMS